MIVAFVVIAAACGKESSVEATRTPAVSRPQAPSEPTPTARAKPTEMKVTVPAATHTVEDPMLQWTDLNVYPADNAVVLQGAAVGPIGDQSHAQFWLAGVHDHNASDGPSHLEAVMVYSIDCEDCPGEETTTARIDSARSDPSTPAHLLGVETMRIEDVDKDGTFEVVCTARFKACCGDTTNQRPYSETIVLTAKGTEIVRVPYSTK